MCTETENLTAYLDGELPPGARARFEAHLPGCPGCQADLALLRGALPQLAAVPALEPSAELRRALLTHLPPQERSLWSRISLSWAVPLGGLAAAAAVTGMMVLGTQKPQQVDLPEGLVLAQNLDLLEDLEVVQSADLSDEDLEVVAQLDQLERED